MMATATEAPQHLQRVLIVGGGTAGWMTAAALSNVLRGDLTKIELIESDDIGTVGVGEATIPAIHDFNRKVGLDEQTLMRETQATFKLGIEFVNWGKRGDSYIHPFGTSGADINGVAFHHYWLDQQSQGNSTPFGQYCLAHVAAKAGRFALPLSDPGSVLSTYSYAYHFDATLYAKHLRQIATRRGVVRTEGRIVDVVTNEGHIDSVRLEDGRTIAADLFIDCSGFRALLIGQALSVEYDDWRHWLPCDRALAVPSDNPERLEPYTRATAHAAGWQWRIPLQHRTGNGHVYSSEYISDDEARSVLIRNLEAPARDEPRLLRFTAGKRRRMWAGNCVAVGLSGGFLEPLESTSIYLIQAAILKLIERFPDAGFAAADRDDFNAQMSLHFEQIRDFIILHYKATQRDDSDFWNYCRTMTVPDSLAHRLRVFEEAGHAVHSRRELFIEPNWIAVLLGQGIVPRSTDLRVDCVPRDKIGQQLERIQGVIAGAANALPTHEATIRGYCAARKEA
jgi:tryptophan halogenase